MISKNYMLEFYNTHHAKLRKNAMSKVEPNHSYPYLITRELKYGSVTPKFYPTYLLSLPTSPKEDVITFERTSPNEFKIHVVSGNPDEIAKKLDIKA